LHDRYNPTRQDYGRRDDYQSYEGFCFQDLLQTQEGFPQNHPYTFRGYNVDGGYYDWRGKDVRGDERVEEDRGEQYERVDGDNDEDEGDDVNARGLGDEGDDCNVLEIQRIEITSLQSMVQHLLQCIMSNEFKRRVLTHIRIQLQKKKELHLYGTTK
jgi:hypothetical protein